MSETVVPIPSGSVPEGARAWSSADAALWAEAGPASWARAVWSVPALLAAVVWVIAEAPVPPCTDAAPCGPDWVGLAEVGLSAGLLYWLVRLPELVLGAAPVLAGVVVWAEVPDAEGAYLAANLAVLAALAFGWAGARERVAARSRQRGLAERAAGTRHPLPGPLGPLLRGRLPLGAGLILCAVAVGAVLLALSGVRADEQRAERATRITAEVVDPGEETVVRAGERRLTVETVYPEDYPVGGTVTVLEDGDWRRLASEPYDAFDWQLLLLVTGLPGLSLLTTGALARRRAGALRHAPVPALRVLEHVDGRGVTWVHAADDTSRRTPLFSCPTVAAPPPDDGPAVEAADDDQRPALDRRLHEAVLIGAPYDGGELVVVTTDRDGRPVVTHTVRPVRAHRSGGWSSWRSTAAEGFKFVP
ncbi:MAG: hypothetical protein H5T76_21745 [Streptomyces sp.]|nr:hypothetical protein [Streptomyces sp.]